MTRTRCASRARAALTELGWRRPGPQRRPQRLPARPGRPDRPRRRRPPPAQGRRRPRAGHHDLRAPRRDRAGRRAAEAASRARRRRLPGREARRPPAAAPAPRESRSPLAGIPKERGRLYAGLAAAAVILIAVVLGVTGVFSGDDEAPAESGETTTTANGEQDPAGGIGQIPDGEELSRVPLESPGKGDAEGAAIVGLSTGDQAYLDLIIENLEPAPQGEAYVVWFMFDDKTGYPLSPIFPDEKGSFNDRFAIPQAVTGLIANTRAIEVSVSNARQTPEGDPEGGGGRDVPDRATRAAPCWPAPSRSSRLPARTRA